MNFMGVHKIFMRVDNTNHSRKRDMDHELSLMFDSNNDSIEKDNDYTQFLEELKSTERNSHKNVLNEHVDKIHPKDPLLTSRTIFIGNVPIECSKKQEYKQLWRLFSRFGEISTIRFRSIAFSEPGMSRKDAFASGSHFHPNRDSFNAYIVFKDNNSVNSALSLHGTLFLGKHLRVDRCDEQKHSFNKKRTIFIGNLAFDVEDEELWRYFDACGRIANLRVIRDRETNFGKGFAYVQFDTIEGLQASLAMNGTIFKERSLRISRYEGENKRNKKSEKKLDGKKHLARHSSHRKKKV